MSLTIAFLGFGEVGQLFTRWLAGKPDVAVSVYDTLFDDPRSEGDLKRRAAESGARATVSAADACRGSLLVISAVTADSVRAARQPPIARQIADLCRPQLVSPTTKRLVAEESAEVARASSSSP